MGAALGPCEGPRWLYDEVRAGVSSLRRSWNPLIGLLWSQTALGEDVRFVTLRPEMRLLE